MTARFGGVIPTAGNRDASDAGTTFAAPRRSFAMPGAPSGNSPSPHFGISPMRLILLILVILLLLGALPAWPYSRGWGYAPVGGLGLILIIVIVLILLGIL
jgi:hypothetical protein